MTNAENETGRMNLQKIGRTSYEITTDVKTLIHHNGALGDLLLSLPCIRAIRRDAGLVHIAGRADVADLLRETGHADEASSAESSFYASLYTAAPEERTMEFLSQFDRAFLFTLRSDSLIAANFRKAVPRTETIITIPPAGVRIHVSEFRMKQLSCRAAVESNAEISPALLCIPTPYKERAREFLAGSGYDGAGGMLIGLHPGSGGKRKCWPIENYLVLAERIIQDRETFFLFFSGQTEGPDVKGKIDHFACGRRRVTHISDAGLVTVAALLSICDLYVGNDSGVTHLAAAVNANVIALFGPTDPLLWKPIGQGAEVISAGPPGGSLQAITVEEVYTRAMALLSRK